MREAGIAMRRQIDSGGDQWTGRVDFRHATLPLIVEIQSERHHTALSDRRADAARRDRLVADGFVVIEITDTLLFSDPREVVAADSIGHRASARRMNHLVRFCSSEAAACRRF